ncbi:hypothetical protein EA462_00320 [Natrarchaeobius halalkaliphilus]|uniref:Lipoprotein n=1 Tax=Natrarchaeobius halalkaliphilus TaxID=1679091 RepID=A0A3N6P923_9EURY|nr:hypothetical protein [Natrarchaeobius halalkaliphilus]RQG92715.1 hypothetical protein EA462_00320 [Natrarchaeobius halalkaliphilus]
MRRRALLATAGTTTFAGCSLPTRCSRPSLRADHLEFESEELGSLSRWIGRETAILATRPAHIDRFEPPERIASENDVELSADDRERLERTAFDESFAVGIVVGSSGQSTSARVTHVVRENERVHCYICIRRRGTTDDWAPQIRLVRVETSWKPESVRVTFTDGRDGTETFDTDGTE